MRWPTRFYLCNMRFPDEDMQDLYQSEEIAVPVGEYIARYIGDERLRNLLAWNNALYAGNRETTPIYVHAIISRLFIEGASRFVGGSQQLADAMCGLIREYGGEVICGDGVKEIVAKNREVKYVLTEKGRRYEAGSIFRRFTGEYTGDDRPFAVYQGLSYPDVCHAEYLLGFCGFCPDEEKHLSLSQ